MPPPNDRILTPLRRGPSGDSFLPERPDDHLAEIPLRRDGTVEQIGKALEERILNGELPPGTALRESVLARRTGVSRNSVREAIRGLVPGGLVRHVPHCGFFVNQISSDEIRQIYGAREVIELAALRDRFKAVQEGIEDLETIVKTIATCAKRRDWNGVSQGDRAFHMRIVAALTESVFRSFAVRVVCFAKTGPCARGSKPEQSRPNGG